MDVMNPKYFFFRTHTTFSMKDRLLVLFGWEHVCTVGTEFEVEIHEHGEVDTEHRFNRPGWYSRIVSLWEKPFLDSKG